MTQAASSNPRPGPLNGFRVIEFAGIGPPDMTAMLLADMGANVLRLERKEPVELGIPRAPKFDLLKRSRKAIALNLKQAAHKELALEFVSQADALIEGFRPGAMERLGLGPDACLARNPRLVYGRMTGWGQSGPLSQGAGHDINYIALTGALAAMGRRDQPPTIPFNIVGDIGGGALYLALGMLAAMLEAGKSGKGQVVDAAIVDGAASLMTMMYGLHAAGIVKAEHGTNAMDGGAPFYDAYQCADDKWVAVGTIEARFYAELLRLLEIDPAQMGAQNDRSRWDAQKAMLAARFKCKTRAQWCEILEGSDACFAPILDFTEAPNHPHMKARGVFVQVDGVVQPAAAPRFSRTPAGNPTSYVPSALGRIEEALQGWVQDGEMARYRGVITAP